MLLEAENESEALAKKVAELEKGSSTGADPTKLAVRVKTLEQEL